MNVMSGFSTLNRLLRKKSKNDPRSKSTSNLHIATELNKNDSGNIVPPTAISIPIDDPPPRTSPILSSISAANVPFEQNFRITVLLPRDQLFVSRIPTSTTLEKLLEIACENKQLDKEKYEFRDVDGSQRYSCDLTIKDVGQTEFRLFHKTDMLTFKSDDVVKMRRQQPNRSSVSSSEASVNNKSNAIIRREKSLSVYSSMNSLNSLESASTGGVGGVVGFRAPIAPARKKRTAPRPPSQIQQHPILTESDNDHKITRAESIKVNRNGDETPAVVLKKKSWTASTPNLSANTEKRKPETIPIVEIEFREERNGITSDKKESIVDDNCNIKYPGTDRRIEIESVGKLPADEVNIIVPEPAPRNKATVSVNPKKRAPLPPPRVFVPKILPRSLPNPVLPEFVEISEEQDHNENSKSLKSIPAEQSEESEEQSNEIVVEIPQKDIESHQGTELEEIEPKPINYEKFLVKENNEVVSSHTEDEISQLETATEKISAPSLPETVERRSPKTFQNYQQHAVDSYETEDISEEKIEESTIETPEEVKQELHEAATKILQDIEYRLNEQLPASPIPAPPNFADDSYSEMLKDISNSKSVETRNDILHKNSVFEEKMDEISTPFVKADTNETLTTGRIDTSTPTKNSEESLHNSMIHTIVLSSEENDSIITSDIEDGYRVGLDKNKNPYESAKDSSDESAVHLEMSDDSLHERKFNSSFTHEKSEVLINIEHETILKKNSENLIKDNDKNANLVIKKHAEIDDGYGTILKNSENSRKELNSLETNQVDTLRDSSTVSRSSSFHSAFSDKPDDDIACNNGNVSTEPKSPEATPEPNDIQNITTKSSQNDSSNLHDYQNSSGLESFKIIKSILNSRKNSAEISSGIKKDMSELSDGDESSPRTSTTSFSVSTLESSKKQDSLIEKSDSSPEVEIKKWKYQGPPSINLTTWSERPKVKVEIKEDNDYKFGGLGNQALATVDQESVETTPLETTKVTVTPINTTELVNRKPALTVQRSFGNKFELPRRNFEIGQPVRSSMIISNNMVAPTIRGFKSITNSSTVKKTVEEKPSNSELSGANSLPYGGNMLKVKSHPASDSSTDQTSLKFKEKNVEVKFPFSQVTLRRTGRILTENQQENGLKNSENVKENRKTELFSVEKTVHLAEHKQKRYSEPVKQPILSEFIIPTPPAPPPIVRAVVTKQQQKTQRQLSEIILPKGNINTANKSSNSAPILDPRSQLLTAIRSFNRDKLSKQNQN